MTIVWPIVITVLILFVPRAMILLADRHMLFRMLSPVFLCYLSGFLLSFLITDASFAMSISEVLVPIAIPLILFTADLKSIRRLAKPILTSFILICLSVCVVAILGFLIFRGSIHDASTVTGMLIGLYTGGTPNLLAIGVALDLPQTDMVLVNTADLLIGGLYFFVLISLMPILVKKILPTTEWTLESDDDLTDHLKHEYVPEKQPFSFRAFFRHLPILLLGALSLGIAAGVALLLTGKLDVMVVMLTVTTCGLGFSLIPKVRAAPGSFAIGQYLIYMFSFAIGLSFKLTAITTRMVMLLLFLGFVQTGAVVLHLILARLLKIDAGITLITSTAGIYGPAFVAPVANAMNRPALVLPGLLCGILGYAMGNYLGIGMATLLRLF